MCADIVQLSPDKIKFSPIEEAIAAIQEGRCIVLADDEGRENEGDLVCAARKITPDIVNFMAKEARGMICVAVTPERAKTLELTQMVAENTDTQQTAFTVTVDAGSEFGVTTGISAADRARTIRRLDNDNAVADDFRRPGHIFPIEAQRGGVLVRVGHTEAAVDFSRLAGLSSMGVICEIMNDDGTMARRDDLAQFAKKHELPFVTIAQLIAWRMQRERFVVRRMEKAVTTRYGGFTAVAYYDELNNVEHIAFIKGALGELQKSEPVVRVQHENILSGLFGDAQSDALSTAMQALNEQQNGVVVFLRNQSDGPQSLAGILRQYGVEKQNKKAAPKMDLRNYGIGAQILADLGVTRFRLMTDNPKKMIALRGYGLEVIDTVKMSGQAMAPSPAPAKMEPAAEHDDAFIEHDDHNASHNDNKHEPHVMSMKMGGQLLSGQSYYEGN